MNNEFDIDKAVLIVTTEREKKTERMRILWKLRYHFPNITDEQIKATYDEVYHPGCRNEYRKIQK